MRIAGIMSGTSLDGVDAAVIDYDGKCINVVAHVTVPYPEEVRRRIHEISNSTAHVAEISRLNFLLPDLYAKAVRRCKVPLETIELVGCHGQTIFHEKGSTLQIGDGPVLAERLGLPVVSNFRTRDIAAGGRGAPLVPFVDYLLFSDSTIGRVALNIGGIANLTAIPAGALPDDIVAFDTGPGNMVVDQLMSKFSKGKLAYDRGGKVASGAVADQDLLTSLLRRAYYRLPPPKTAGREQFGREFINDLVRTGLSLPNLIATATALTPATIAASLKRFIKFPVHELVVSGGGAENPVMMAHLKAHLPSLRIRTADEFGIDGGAKEAIAFAVLAYQTWFRQPSNLPSATGAKRPVILGSISF